MPSEPDDAAAHYNLGVDLGKKGDPDGAIEEYREALRLNPNLPEAHGGLGVELGQKGNADGAIVEFREAIRLKPDYANAHYNLGFALSGKGEIDGAMMEFREVVRLNPDHETAHLNLGIALYNKGDWDGAIAECREALRLNPKDELAHTNLGAALDHKGDWDGAIAEHREALRLNPNNEFAHYNLGRALNEKGDLEGAIAEIREALRLNPENEMAQLNLGRLLRSEGKIRGSTVTRFFGELGFGAGYFLMVALVYVASRFDGWIFGTTHTITLADLMAFICFSTLWVLWAMNQYYKYFTAPSEERNAFPTSAGPFCPTFAYMPTPGMGVSPAMIIGGAIGAGAGGMATPTHPWVGAFLGVLIGMPGGQMASMGIERFGAALRRWGTRKD